MGGSARRRKANPGIPEDMVMEILIRLPGKQVGRCKCVCKSWRSMIGSAHFKDAYGTKNRGLILYRFEPHSARDLNIYYSPISDNQKQDEGEELEFSRLNKLRFHFAGNNRMYMYKSITRMVNGLVCVDYSNGGWLSICNVCTGERMRVPDELPDEDARPVCKSADNGRIIQPVFHLGFDPASRTYKLLRLKYYGNSYPDYAHIMTLRPSSSSSSSEWEPIKFGVGDYIPKPSEISRPSKKKISPNDGFLCWFLPENDLILFDFSKDKFHKISIPRQFVIYPSGEGFVRAQFMERQQRLAVSLWAVSRRSFGKTRRPRRLEWFVMEDDEGKRWTQHFVELPLQLDRYKEVFAVPNGSLSEMVVVNSAENEVYCYDHTSTMKKAQFRVGKQLDYPMDTSGLPPPPPGSPFYTAYTSTLSCLSDGNNLYLPLDDILSASK